MARFLFGMVLVVFLGPLVIPAVAAGLALLFALGAVLLAVAAIGAVVCLVLLPFKLASALFCG